MSSISNHRHSRLSRLRRAQRISARRISLGTSLSDFSVLRIISAHFAFVGSTSPKPVIATVFGSKCAIHTVHTVRDSRGAPKSLHMAISLAVAPARASKQRRNRQRNATARHWRKFGGMQNSFNPFAYIGVIPFINWSTTPSVIPATTHQGHNSVSHSL